MPSSTLSAEEADEFYACLAVLEGTQLRPIT